jgi:hypothetical protein
VTGEMDDIMLREPGTSYGSFFGAENEAIGMDNAIFFNIYPEILNG